MIYGRCGACSVSHLDLDGLKHKVRPDVKQKENWGVIFDTDFKFEKLINSEVKNRFFKVKMFLII